MSMIHFEMLASGLSFVSLHMGYPGSFLILGSGIQYRLGKWENWGHTMFSKKDLKA